MLEVLFVHQDFVAINKPTGWSVHQEENQPNLSWVLMAQLGVERVWLLHRLDKLTSGILLYALNEKAASELTKKFANQMMGKTYLALSDAKPTKKQGWVKGGMEKARRGAWKLTRKLNNQAITYFQSKAISPNLRLFLLQPHTGKTHQLRVAMKSLGSAILGDTLYAGTNSSRLFLHAWKIKFEYLGENFMIIAPLGEEWPSECLSIANEIML